MDTLASTGTDMLIQHGIPWLGKKAVEMGRYYGSEALRNPNLQNKAIDYALSKATPFVQKTGSEMFDNLSTKIRPKRRYKTDRKELDGGNLDTILEQLVHLVRLHQSRWMFWNINSINKGSLGQIQIWRHCQK